MPRLARIDEESEDLKIGRPVLPDVYVPQSGEAEAGISISPAAPMAVEQITTFADQTAGWKTDIGTGRDSTMDLGSNSDSDLGNFLSRPLRAKKYQWTVGNPFFQTFNPWADFFTDERISEKLAYYELLRCTMNMKIVVSGTGFHYGRALVSYNPLSGYDQLTVERNFLDIDLIQASQKPHFFINPCTNEAGEMTFPFFFQNNFLSLSRSDYNDMGEVTIKDFEILKHANGGNDPVDITVYLWASDIVLAMPTSTTSALSIQTSLNYTPQAGNINSGDEYGKGIISKPASAIAAAAGKLTNVPMIGPYAKATQMVSSAVGATATLFGYSRPPVVTDMVLQKPSPTGNMANTDAADAVQKLTLDSKQELTIDSRTVGLDGTDQMSIKSFITRESYLTRFDWGTSSAADVMLWNSKVTPMLYRSNTQLDGAEIHATPMAYLSQYFEQWQGTIIFRFQIVKSAFHKGRLLVRYDPRTHSATPQYGTNYSRVVDIAEEEDFEISVGWGQSGPFLITGEMWPGDASFGQIPIISDPSTYYNGVLAINVLNSLVSPSADSDITINVFVRAGDDMKYVGPTERRLDRLHLWPQPPEAAFKFQPQSGMADTTALAEGGSDIDKPVGASPIQSISSTLGPVNHTMEVFGGEEVTSLRQLFRRYVFSRTYVPNAPLADTYQWNDLSVKALPYSKGFDDFGLDLAADGLTSLTVGREHPLSYFMPCYAGWRGGLRKKFLFSRLGDLSINPIVGRREYTATNGWTYTSFDTSGATGDNAIFTKFLNSQTSKGTNAGCATTNLGINNTIEVELPYYTASRFSPARMPSADFCNGATSASVAFPSTNVTSVGPVPDVVSRTAVTDYTATGEDFTLFFFTGCPILYNYDCVETT